MGVVFGGGLETRGLEYESWANVLGQASWGGILRAGDLGRGTWSGLLGQGS